tara:strand:- start:2476 stop:3480 length:1005 start_codon:yes stop_codon:yes gene_type:complete
MTKAFVTGAAGFIGSHIAEELYNQGYDVMCLVHKPKDAELLKNLGIDYVVGDLLEPDSYKDAIAEDVVIFHSAALTLGAKVSEEAYMQVNAEAVQTLLELAKEKKARQFVFIGSACVYGDRTKIEGSIDERTEHNPINPYGRSKVKAEKFVKEFYEKSKISTLVIRPTSVYGPRMANMSGASKLFRITKKAVIPIIRREGAAYNFTYVKNLVKGIVLAQQKVSEGYEEFNMADPSDYDFEHVVRTIVKYWNPNAKIVVIPYSIASKIGKLGDLVAKKTGKKLVFTTKTLNTTISKTRYDCSKQKEVLGFEPVYSLDQGIQETVAWLKSVAPKSD